MKIKNDTKKYDEASDVMKDGVREFAKQFNLTLSIVEKEYIWNRLSEGCKAYFIVIK